MCVSELQLLTLSLLKTKTPHCGRNNKVIADDIFRTCYLAATKIVLSDTPKLYSLGYSEGKSVPTQTIHNENSTSYWRNLSWSIISPIFMAFRITFVKISGVRFSISWRMWFLRGLEGLRLIYLDQPLQVTPQKDVWSRSWQTAWKSIAQNLHLVTSYVGGGPVLLEPLSSNSNSFSFGIKNSSNMVRYRSPVFLKDKYTVTRYSCHNTSSA